MGGDVFSMVLGPVISKVVGSFVGGKEKAPKVDTAPAQQEVDTAATNTKKARTALLETAGGTAGAQLQPGQVANSRDTILGN